MTDPQKPEVDYNLVAVKRKYVPEWLYAVCSWPIDLVAHQPFRWLLTTPVKFPKNPRTMR